MKQHALMGQRSPCSALCTLVLLIAILVVLRGRAIVGQGWLNAGFWRLNDKLAGGEGPSPEADYLWQKAVHLSRTNQRVWRGYGFFHWWQGQEQEALKAWQCVVGMDVELLSWADGYRKQGADDEALVWYRLVTKLSPDMGDPWYFVGQIHQTQQHWKEALLAYETAVQRTRFLYPVLSDAYFQQGLIYQTSSEYRQLESALYNYDQALAVDMFSTDVIKAEAFYKRGEIYSWQNKNPSLSLAQYQQAVTLYPGHNWARLRMGYAIYWAEGDLETAVTEIERVISVWQKSNSPYLKSAYVYMGDIYRDAGLVREALGSFILAGSLDPTDTAIQAIIDELREENR